VDKSKAQGVYMPILSSDNKLVIHNNGGIVLNAAAFYEDPVYNDQDLTWDWAVRAGGTGADIGYAIESDNNGNQYVCGTFSGSITLGTTTLSSSGSLDAFVAKMDANGNWLWAVKIGAAGNDYLFRLAIGASGNCYVCGISPVDRVFLGKISPTGTWFWTKTSNGASHGVKISLDSDENVYLGGNYAQGMQLGHLSLPGGAHGDGFLAKADTNGNWLWLKRINSGTNGEDYIYGVGLDSNNNIYIGIIYTQTLTIDGQTVSAQNRDLAVAKLDPSGTCIWLRRAGGSSGDHLYHSCTDRDGNTYVTGNFDSATMVFGSITLTRSGGTNIFIAKIDANGNWLWAKNTTGGSSISHYVNLSQMGNVYITGVIAGTVTFGTNVLVSNGANNDIFIAKLSSSGEWLQSIRAGGTGVDTSRHVTINKQGHVFITGDFTGTAVFGTTSLTANGSNSDIFVAKLNT